MARPGPAATNGEDAHLSVTIMEAATGRGTPVRVRIADAEGQPFGLAGLPRFSAAARAIRLAVPGTVPGLPAEAIAVMYGPQDEAHGFAFQPDGSFNVNGSFSLPLPAGRYTIALSKGYEFERISETS